MCSLLVLLLGLLCAITSARKSSEEQGDADTDTGGGDYSLGSTRTHSGGKEYRGLQISGNQLRGRPGSDNYFCFLGTRMATAPASCQISAIVLTID